MSTTYQNTFSKLIKWVFAENHGYTLSILRVLVGTVFIMKLIGLVDLLQFQNLDLAFPKHTFKNISNYRIDGFRLAYPFFEWLPLPSFSAYNWIEKLQLGLALLWTIGLGTRFVGLALFSSYCYLFLLSQFSFSHHVWLMLLVLSVLAFSPCYKHFSLDALIARSRKVELKAFGSRCPLLMLQFLVSAVYLFTAASKTIAGWHTGDALSLYLNSSGSNQFIGPILRDIDNFAFLSVSVIISMLFVGLALWHKQLRWLAVIIGIGIHAGIDLSLGVQNFSYLMWVLYIAFFHREIESFCKKRHEGKILESK